jgi:phosphoribosyl 1,2-cyclic phosphodiesterase
MRIAVLGSGSRGNALVVESDGGCILIDAGFSTRELVRRLAQVGVVPESVRALVLTHEHADHVSGADRFARRFRVPVWATAGTLQETALSTPVREGARPFCSGRPVEVAGFSVEAFAIPHDAREPVGLVVEDDAGCRLGLAADLGCASRLAWGRLVDLDVLLLETNHDLEMLRGGPYPWALKQRIAGRHGHLSNGDAAVGLAELASDRLRSVVAYHLSQTNNLPVLASTALGETLDRAGSAASVLVAQQDEPMPWVEVNR